MGRGSRESSKSKAPWQEEAGLVTGEGGRATRGSRERKTSEGKEAGDTARAAPCSAWEATLGNWISPQAVGSSWGVLREDCRAARVGHGQPS